MLLEALVSVSDLGRLRDIAGVLVKHGFGDLVRRTGVRRMLAKAGHALHLRATADLKELSSAVRFRSALEELGPTFAKLGQLLASRPDLLPPDWIQELSALHQNVTAVPFETIRAQLEEDLGEKPEDAFLEFDPEPIACGTIAQVYAATLKNGGDVVVKVRRPGISGKVEADMRLLSRLAHLLEQEDGELRRFRPQHVVRDFSRMMRAELDMRIEARNLLSIAEKLAERTDVAVPEVVDSFTAERVLVMTRLRGLSAAEWLADRNAAKARPAAGAEVSPAARHASNGDPDLATFDPIRVAVTGTDLVLEMIFGQGLFHADPHPGNLLFLPDGRIGLLDFGQVGRLSETRRRELVRLLAAVAQHDEEAAVDVLLGWADEDGVPDIQSLAADTRGFIDRYEGVPLQRLDIKAMLMDVTDVVRENQLVLPSDVAVLIKVFVTLEGLGRALYPEFDLSARVEPAAEELFRQIASPRAILRRNIKDVRTVLMNLPGDLRSLMTRARRGQMKLDIDLKRLERFGQQINRSSNRLTVGMITAALIIGTSIAMTTDTGPTLFGLPALGLFGFLCSAAIGLGLLWSILRSR